MRLLRALWAIAAVATLAVPRVHASSALGPMAMRARHAGIASQLADNAFGRPLLLQSQQAARRQDGDVYAVLDHPFALVSSTLSDPLRWCDILILHLNTKHCRRTVEDAATRIPVRVGKKEEQPVHTASLLDFAWRAPVVRQDYMVVARGADDGPYDTRDYELLVEAVPLDGGRTFLHLGYSFSFGGASSLAMKLYLATVGRDKVGFTLAGQPPEYVQGMRGVTERNTMRYCLAIDAYLDSLAAPAGQQLDKRLAAWFAATARYPRQLHEVDRDAYLHMKRSEVQRQQAQP